jgi:NADPH:quinone reductase-like Zn-dependent oxidoreductase
MRRVAARGKVQPEVIGHDFAGTVMAVGVAVTQFEVGDEVFGAHKARCGVRRRARVGRCRVEAGRLRL